MINGMRMMGAVVLALVLAGVAGAATTTGQETYELLFRNGTLDNIARDRALVYAREVENTRMPQSAERDTGKISLSFESSDDTPEQAHMLFMQDGKYRNIGSFPASVGNPMIMYFTETVVRDMVETVGGSPFYVRNRVKEALIEPANTEEVQVSWNGSTVTGQQIVLHPFEGDRNADRMSGFDRMTLTVTVSEDVPGWYHSLVAEVPGEEAPLYVSGIRLSGVEAAE